MGIFKKSSNSSTPKAEQSETSKEFDRFTNYGDAVSTNLANKGWTQSTPDQDPFMPTEGWNS